jgi:NADPH:quinone reductase-like Zn-dependent oxidoreductase
LAPTRSSIDTAGRRPLAQLRRALTAKGTLVIVGGEGGGKWLGGFQRSVVFAPVLSLFSSQSLRPLISSERAEDLEALTELIEAGQVMPAVDRSFALADAPDAVRYLRDRDAGGKVVIAVSES